MNRRRRPTSSAGVALLDSGTFGFANGGAGAAITLDGAPAVGQLDVLLINSDATVTSVVDPSGGAAWVQDEAAVLNQGAYIYSRRATGGEGTTVTITTAVNANAAVSWLRFRALTTVDTSTNTQANGSAGNATPAHSTGPMAANVTVVALGALHSIGTANQTAPQWSDNFVGITDVVQGSGAQGVRNYAAVKIGTGPAAATPQVSWTGDACTDRYMLAVSYRV